MAELEKLKVTETAHKAFKNLDKRIDNYLENLNTRFGLGDIGMTEGTERGLGADAS
jgi:hypothetical protein